MQTYQWGQKADQWFPGNWGGVEKRGRDSKEILRSNDYVHYLGFDDI